MATFSWAKNTDGDWNNPANWTQAAVPNDPAADVTIDAATTIEYGVTIAPGALDIVNSITLNGTNNFYGTNTTGYPAAELVVQGTLEFAPTTSAGRLSGSLQSFMVLNNGTLINPGTVDAFIQTVGNVLITGTNGFYVTNWLQSLGAVTTIDTPIAELSGNTLFDGIFEAKGTGAMINLGGSSPNVIVNIATIEGPPVTPTNPDGWTEIIFNGQDTSIDEYNGSAYVPLETSLVDIGVRGTLDVLGARNYDAGGKALTIDGGMLNLQGGTFSATGLDINSGVVQGFGTLAAPVANNGTLDVEGGTMVLTAALSGTGQVGFDMDLQAGTVVANGATLQVGAVSAGQTITMRGDDTLILTNPGAFAGTIVAQQGDKLAFGSNVTGATLNNGTLAVNAGATTIASIRLADSAETSGSFTAANGVITIGSSSSIVAVSGKSVFNDFYGTGESDILWQNSPSGAVALWQMNGSQVTSSTIIGGSDGWSIVGTGDFNGDGKSDILWRDSASGTIVEWQMNGAQQIAAGAIGGAGGWTIAGTGDFDGDGKTDILWQGPDGSVVEWTMNGLQATNMAFIGGAGGGWKVVGTGDFNGDGKTDILWQNSASGAVVQWEMNGSQVISSAFLGGGDGWNVVGTGDFNGDGKTDILWQNSANGAVVQWEMNGSQVISSAILGGDNTWKPLAV